MNIVNKDLLSNIEFIHYWNTNKFDNSLFRPLSNSNMSKPHWWLWWSPVNSKYWWVDFVETEFEKPINWGLNNSFLFKIHPSAKIIYIDNEDDINNIYSKYKIYGGYSLDYEKMAKKYDWIYMSENWNTCSHEMDNVTPLNFYDCECIIVFHSDVIMPEIEIEIQY